jgi:two-component system sensor histidine kinase NblS
VTDVFVPLIRSGTYYGVLGLGVNPNETALASAALTREVTVAVFISIWVLVILGAVFNALTITRPVKELLRGVRSVASGDFQARVDLPMGGELGELLTGFNAMASQLEAYDEANIEELTAAQVKQQSLIATMADGAILLDATGRIVLANPTSDAYFAGKAAVLKGRNWSRSYRNYFPSKSTALWMPSCSAARTVKTCAAVWANPPGPSGS